MHIIADDNLTAQAVDLKPGDQIEIVVTRDEEPVVNWEITLDVESTLSIVEVEWEEVG